MDILHPIPAATANSLSDEEMRSNPAFTNNPSYLTAQRELTFGEVNEMLAMGIPALSPSVGNRAISTRILLQNNQINLNPGNTYKPNGWPNRTTFGQNWLHSDLRNVAYFYNYKLFEKIVNDGDLK
jgi:hypothetical protein